MTTSDTMTLTVLTPEKTLLEAGVSKVSLPGSKGRFMILKDHAPIISSLEEGDVIFESDGVTEKVNIIRRAWKRRQSFVPNCFRCLKKRE